MKYILATTLILFACSCTPTSHPENHLHRRCLGGHEYWESRFVGSYAHVLAPILENNGNPIKCLDLEGK